MKLRNIALLILALTLIFPAATTCLAMNWTQINTDGFGNPNNQWMSGAFYNQKLYIATGNHNDVGDADGSIKIFEYDGSDWQQVNTNGFGDPNNVLEGVKMVAYDGLLYVGTKNENGTQIWTYDGSDWSKLDEPNDPLLHYCILAEYNGKLYFASGFGDHDESHITVRVLEDGNWIDTGFDDGNVNEKIDDMTTYDGKLYVSTYSEGRGFQIWAYDDDAAGEKWALAADRGIDDPDNHVCVSMSVHDNQLLANTANMITGGQLWAYDGQQWTQINENGFGNADNLSVGAHSYRNTLIAGTYNIETGGELWLLDGTNWIQVNSSADFNNPPKALLPSMIIDQLGLFTISDNGIGIYVLAPPTAEAGADQTVIEDAAVSLDGSGSATGSGDTYAWLQLSGSTVTLSDAAALSPTFTAPQVEAGGESLVFELTITDNGGHQASDQVTITVANQCTLTTAAQGGGTILLDPEGGTYAEGATISLTAQPAAGYQFERWEGGATGSQNPMNLTLNEDTSVTAVFIERTDGSGDSGSGGGGGGCFIGTID